MTTTRERQSAPSPDNGAPRWSERSAFGNRRGIPLWGAMLLALVLTAAGGVPDLLLDNSTGWLSRIGLLIGCVLAVVLVQRRSVFGPMVQPPLVTLIIPVLAMFFGQGGGGGGISGLALSLINPLINSFPMMAITTAICLLLGLARTFWLERAGRAGDPEATARRKPVAKPDAAKQRARKEPERKEAGRKGASRKDAAGKEAAERGRSRRSEGRPDERGRPRQDSSGRPRRPASSGESGRPRQGQSGGGRPRGGPAPEPKPERGAGRGGQGGRPQPGRGAPGREQPPRGGQGGGRPAPGRGRSEPKPEPQRRPRRPRRDDFWD